MVGLITYMRTDSVNLTDEAITEIRGFIAERYGADQMPPEPRHYKTVITSYSIHYTKLYD